MIALLFFGDILRLWEGGKGRIEGREVRACDGYSGSSFSGWTGPWITIKRISWQAAVTTDASSSLEEMLPGEWQWFKEESASSSVVDTTGIRTWALISMEESGNQCTIISWKGKKKDHGCRKKTKINDTADASLPHSERRVGNSMC